MIDFIILLQSHPYAVVGQHHPGWVGFLQDHVLNSLNCVWFNRGEASDRRVVADRLKAHAHDSTRKPLLVFPEGTCVNNEYVVQFKKGVFELGVPINPVAIKYNKVRAGAGWWGGGVFDWPRLLHRQHPLHPPALRFSWTATGTPVSSPLRSTCFA